MTSPIPEGYHSLTAYIVVPDAKQAIAFYEKAFGAVAVMHMPGHGGQGTMHAEIKIGDSHLMLTDENPNWEMKSSQTLGGSPVSFMVYLEDCDAAFAQAIEAGCTEKFPLADMFWGDRMGKVADPFGIEWSLTTHKEDVPPEEMPARQQKWLEEMQQQGASN